MIESEKIKESLEFQEVNYLLKQKYDNNITELFTCESLNNDKYYFDALWHFRNDSSIIWQTIILYGPAEWTLNIFYRFREYLDWNDISKNLQLGYYSCAFGIDRFEFLEMFKAYVNWKIIKHYAGYYAYELKKRFKDYWK